MASTSFLAEDRITVRMTGGPVPLPDVQDLVMPAWAAAGPASQANVVPSSDDVLALLQSG